LDITKIVYLYKMERWKNVKYFKGYYQVSNSGNVKGLRRIIKHNYGGNSIKSEKILKQRLSRGYFGVRLCKKNIVYDKLVHRLVAEVFIPNPENKPYINHKNGIKNDNHYKNLEWCTQKENIIHSYKMGLSKSGELHYNYGKIGYNATFAICLQTGEILSSFDLSKKYNVSLVHINRMLAGKRTNKTSFIKLGQGVNSVREVLETNPELLLEISDKVKNYSPIEN